MSSKFENVKVEAVLAIVDRRCSRIMGVLLGCCLIWFLVSIPLYAEVIDRIVAVVEGRPVTLSDLAQERNIRSILGEKPIEDDNVLIQQLIEQHLIETQIADFPGVDVSDDEIDSQLSKAITGAFPRDSLREAVRKRIRISKYFE